MELEARLVKEVLQGKKAQQAREDLRGRMGPLDLPVRSQEPMAKEARLVKEVL
jgi:hypothetical protein